MYYSHELITVEEAGFTGVYYTIPLLLHRSDIFHNKNVLKDLLGWVRWLTAQEFETSLPNMVKLHLYKKYKNYLGLVVCSCGLSFSGG